MKIKLSVKRACTILADFRSHSVTNLSIVTPRLLLSIDTIMSIPQGLNFVLRTQLQRFMKLFLIKKLHLSFYN